MTAVRSRRRLTRGSLAFLATVVPLVLVACSGSPEPEPTRAANTALACPLDREQREAIAARVSDALEAQLELALGRAYADLRAVLVDVCGEPVHEEYRSTTAEQTHEVASVTKSFVATLVGLALADGSLTSLDQTLGQLLPQHRDVMTEPVAEIRLRELLTMTAGLDADLADSTTGPWITSDQFVEEILRAGIVSTRGEFHYSSASSHLLAAIVAKATGRSVLEYATDTLFDPLGIDTTGAAEPVLDISNVKAFVKAYEEAGFAWPVDHQGVNYGGGWLKIRPRDMAKLGQLYLDQGRWQNRQVVSADWVREATRGQVPTIGGYGGEQYGYQWWVTEAGGHPAYAAVGYGGQLVEVVPAKSLVAVFSTHLDADFRVPAMVGAKTYQNLVSWAIVPALP